MSAAPSNLAIAMAHARAGRPVAIGCPPDEQGACTCGGYWDEGARQLVPHPPKAVGKAPIGKLMPTGISGATTNTATIERLWRARPDGNVNVELQASSWVVVDTDSPEVEAAALSRGLDGAAIRESRNRAYVYARPDDCPVVNLIKSEGDPLDVLTLGNFVVHGTHQTGCPVRLDPGAEPGPAPAWVVDLLKRKAADKAAQEAATVARRAERAAQYGTGGEPPVRLHQRGQRRWSGELVATTKDGKLDRDLSLFFLALDLAECNATEGTIVAALEERDAALGWNKFTGRKDAEKRYGEIAEKAVARAIEREQTISEAPEPVHASAGVDTLRAALDAAEAETARLRRHAMDQDDLIQHQRSLVASDSEKRRGLTETLTRVTDVLAIPTAQLSPVGKILTIVTVLEAHSRAGREVATLPTSALMKRSGLSKNTVNDFMQDLAARDGSPIDRRIKSEWVERGDGTRVRETISLVSPRFQTVNESLAAVPMMGGPSDKAVAKAKAKRDRETERELRSIPFGRCSSCDNDTVAVTGKCPRHDEVVGRVAVRRETFQALDTNRWDPLRRGAPPVSDRTYGPNRWDPPARKAAERWRGVVDPARWDPPEQPSWLGEWPEPPDPTVFRYDDVGVAMAAGGAE